MRCWSGSRCRPTRAAPIPIRAAATLARLHRQDLRAREGRVRARSAGRQRDARAGPVRRMAPGASAAAGHAGAVRGRRRQAARRDPASGEHRGRQAVSVPDHRRGRRLSGEAELPPLGRHADRRAAAQRPARSSSKACSRSATARAAVPRGPGRGASRRRAQSASWAPNAILWAVLGAILGGILLNLMPCVFPILALKALHVSRAGGDAGEVAARRAGLYRRRGRRHRRARRAVAGDPRRGGGGGLGVPAAGPANDHAAAAAGDRDHRQPARPVRAAGPRRAGAAGGQLRHRRARRLRRDALRRAVPRRGAGHRAAASRGRIGAGVRGARPRAGDPVPAGRLHPGAAKPAAQARAVDEAAAALPRHTDGRDARSRRCGCFTGRPGRAGWSVAGVAVAALTVLLDLVRFCAAPRRAGRPRHCSAGDSGGRTRDLAGAATHNVNRSRRGRGAVERGASPAELAAEGIPSSSISRPTGA